MLTRLKVSGFKNLVDTEVRFGPLTCIAGFNGVGKSNLFDAVRFLSLLADHSFVEAATMTRGGHNVTDLFTAGGDGRMSFECDMLISPRGLDDFRQPAQASQTFLTYRLNLRLDEEGGLPRVRLEEEGLEYITRNEARARLGFDTSPSWRDSVVQSSKRRAAFISTEGLGEQKLVRLSSDKMRDEAKTKRGGGRPADFLARNLPRTVLSAAQNADEARTAVLVRSEMRDWQILQLEPSALRQPDELQAPTRMASTGRHLAATLHRLAHAAGQDPDQVYASVSNRLAELVEDVRSIEVDRNDIRRLLQLVMTDRDGVALPASSLSDGTLRFVALAVLAQDPEANGVMLLEEPENGIHPERMDALMTLLGDIAVDPHRPVDVANPLRQIVVSTHSPIVAARVGRGDLVFADRRDPPTGVGRTGAVVIRPVRGTWRDGPGVASVGVGQLLDYLGSVAPTIEDHDERPRGDTVYEAVTAQLDLFHASA